MIYYLLDFIKNKKEMKLHEIDICHARKFCFQRTTPLSQNLSSLDNNLDIHHPRDQPWHICSKDPNEYQRKNFKI